MYKMFHGTIYKVRSSILHVDRSCEDMYNKIGLPYPPRCLIEKCAQDVNIAKSIWQSPETLFISTKFQLYPLYEWQSSG